MREQTGRPVEYKGKAYPSIASLARAYSVSWSSAVRAIEFGREIRKPRPVDHDRNARIWAMYQGGDYSYQDIANALNMTRSAVAGVIHRKNIKENKG